MPELGYPDPELACELVRLRPWRDGDLPAIVSGFSDPLAYRFSRAQLDAYTEADGVSYLAEQEQSRLRGTEIHFAYVIPDDDALVLGGGSLYAVDLDQRRAATGYWLAPDARGRGIATAALRLTARWAFDALGLARLELTCAPDNVTSQAVAERCGFAREGVLRSHVSYKGGRRDTVMFSLLPGELT
jgi:RimJ/RimL family protein N-acetyltransferase